MKGLPLNRFDKGHWEILSSGRVWQATQPGHGDAAHGSRLLQLETAGLAQPAADAAEGEDRMRLLRFALRHGLELDLLAVCGIHLAMVNVTIETAGGAIRQTASGTGFSPWRALISCLAEAVEFHSWVYRPADRARLVDPVQVGPVARLDAARVLGFSASQIDARERLNRVWDGWDCVPAPHLLQASGPLIEVASFDRTHIGQAPALLAFGHFGALVQDDPSSNVDSNGCAAGATAAAAWERGLLELVERDATGIWWNRGCVRARLDATRFEDEVLRQAIASHRAETGRRLWFLDISAFRNAPVLVAVSCEASGAQLALGFGVGFTQVAAARRAFLELVQTELSYVAFEARRTRHAQQTAFDRRMLRWLRSADIRGHRFAIGEAAPSASEQLPARIGSLDNLFDEFAAAGLGPVWFLDLTRTENEVPVFKALCEGLAHYKQRQGCDRLVEVPRDNGWTCTRGVAKRSDRRRLLV